ncbi:MAG: glycosyltransferase family 2 protein [Candidatus Aenigmarchaeota archaeon]|nr:glycosyltransferase family 2 protein [Candidatus Aenigmarchaeota archaeon]
MVMLVSVIVCSKNEEKYIGKCLEALRKQTIKPEIIVVDGHSKDKTFKIAEKLADKVFLDHGKGISEARNLGWKSAGGKIIAFCDADTIPYRDWVETILGGIGKNIAVFGPLVPYDGGKRAKLNLKIWGHYFLRVSAKLRYPCLCTGNLAVLRTALKAVGGFDENVNILEDFELGTRLRKLGKIKFLPKMCMPVSSRRYQQGFAKTALEFYIANAIRIKVLKKSPKTSGYWK